MAGRGAHPPTHLSCGTGRSSPASCAAAHPARRGTSGQSGRFLRAGRAARRRPAGGRAALGSGALPAAKALPVCAQTGSSSGYAPVAWDRHAHYTITKTIALLREQQGGPGSRPPPSPSVAKERTMAARSGSSGQRSPSTLRPATNESFSSISCWMVRSSSTRPRSRAAWQGGWQGGGGQGAVSGSECRQARARGCSREGRGVFQAAPAPLGRPSEQEQSPSVGHGRLGSSQEHCGTACWQVLPLFQLAATPAPRTFHISRPRALSCSATVESPPVVRDLMWARRSSQGMCTAGTSPTSPSPCSSAVWPPWRSGAAGAAAAAAATAARRAPCRWGTARRGF